MESGRGTTKASLGASCNDQLNRLNHQLATQAGSHRDGINRGASDSSMTVPEGTRKPKHDPTSDSL